MKHQRCRPVLQGRVFGAVVVCLGGILSACGGSAGVLKTPRTSWQTNQLHEQPATLAFRTSLGWQVQPLGPTAGDQSPQVILDPTFSVEGVDPTGRIWILKDPKTNFFIWHRGVDPAPVEIKALRGRAGSMAVTPDWKTVAVSRHADFSRPQSHWKNDEDDRLYIIDVQTRAVKVLPKSVDQLVTRLAWGEAPATEATRPLFVQLMQTKYKEERFERVDLDTNTKEFVSAMPPRAAWQTASKTCEHVGRIESDDTGIHLVTSENKRKTVVVLAGRKRGFHDYRPTFEETRFGPSCRLLYFRHAGTLFSATVDTPHKIGELVGGSSMRILLPSTEPPPVAP